MRRLFAIAVLGVALIQAENRICAAALEAPGLLKTVRLLGESDSSDSIGDVAVSPLLASYVPSGDPVSVFLPAALFEIEWSGHVSVPLRDDYRFRAWVSGEFTLIINGETVLLHSARGDWSEATEEIRLKKGLNEVRARLRSEAGRDTGVRVEWSSPDFLFEPIGESRWSHKSTEELRRFSELREGRALFRDLQCASCHMTGSQQPYGSNLVSGVDLDAIGQRRQPDWIQRWIQNPKGVRPTARMPRLLRGEQASQDSAAIAAFLSHQSSSAAGVSRGSVGDVSSGKALYAELNCAACHQAGEKLDPSDDRLWLGGVAEKFYVDSLVSFLIQPNRHHPEIRMPQFGFSEREAQDLAAFLVGDQGVVYAKAPPGEDAVVARGRELVGRSGCASCHSSLRESLGESASNQPKPIVNLDNGCLSAGEAIPLSVPDFGLTELQRKALRSVLRDQHPSLNRELPLESVNRLQTELRCASCHGEIQGVPSLEHFGGKLQARWMNDLLSGQLNYKSRPWLAARMPAFPGYAETLVKGLSHRHGYNHKDPPPVEIDDDLAEIGRQLISPFEGFSCVACHGVGDLKPTQVFESEGINLAYSGERLRRDYFRRWILNPIRIDASTKMPVYFDEEGNSPLYDVLDGDTNRQLDAMWHYIALGEWMVPPPVE